MAPSSGPLTATVVVVSAVSVVDVGSAVVVVGSVVGAVVASSGIDDAVVAVVVGFGVEVQPLGSWQSVYGQEGVGVRGR